MKLWSTRERRIEAFEDAISRQFVSKIAPDDSEIGKVRKSANNLSSLANCLTRELNFVADCTTRVSLNNIRLLSDTSAASAEKKSGIAVKDFKKAVAEAAKKVQGRKFIHVRKAGSVGARKKGNVRLAESVKAKLAKKNPKDWSKIPVREGASTSTAVFFEPIEVKRSPGKILKVKCGGAGRTVGMDARVDSSAFVRVDSAGSNDLERPERPQAPAPLVVTIPTDPFPSQFRPITPAPIPPPSPNMDNMISAALQTPPSDIEDIEGVAFGDQHPLLPRPRFLNPRRPVICRTVGAGGTETVVSVRSAPRLVRRRAFSLADIDDPVVPFTFSPRTYRQMNPPPFDTSTPVRVGGEFILIFKRVFFL